jgi:hypothetical protein
MKRKNSGRIAAAASHAPASRHSGAPFLANF